MKDVADDLALIVRNAIAYIKELERQVNELKQAAEPVQEPVAWMTVRLNVPIQTTARKDVADEWLKWGEVLPLYTAPPQRKPEPNSDYERGFVDGMSEQARRSVDKAVNAMTKCKPLAEEEGAA